MKPLQRIPPGGGLPERIFLSVPMPFLRSSSSWKKKLGEGKKGIKLAKPLLLC
jgi:hypothetical protein